MNKKISISVLILGIIVSISAALYSVLGLGSLFSGARIHVMIMATSLEISKVVITGVIHYYWKDLNGWLKSYLITAIIILMVITSAGIYGFLSAAFQETYEKDKIETKKIDLIETRKSTFQETYNYLIKEKESIINNISELNKGFNIQNSTINSDGERVTYTSGKVQERIQTQLSKFDNRLSSVEMNINDTRDSIELLEFQIIDNKLNSESSSELGPLKYVQSLTSKPMEEIINWFICIIILVFDPLAIALVILAINIWNLKSKKLSTSLPIVVPNIKPKNELDDLIDETFKSQKPNQIRTYKTK